MIRFRQPPAASEPGQTTLAAGANLADALALFAGQTDCIGCDISLAAATSASDETLARIRETFAPLAVSAGIIRPDAGTAGLFKRGGAWTKVDIDTRAQRLRSVRMPSALVGSQRLLAVNDLRGNASVRPDIAIGLWAQFAHPVVRVGARFGGTTDGLTAEIALAVHSDRYVLLESDRELGLTFVLSTPDIIAAELIVLALRERRARHRGVGPWEDRLVQAATDLDLGVRNAEAMEIDAIISPTLSSQQTEAAATVIRRAAESVGVEPAA